MPSKWLKLRFKSLIPASFLLNEALSSGNADVWALPVQTHEMMVIHNNDGLPFLAVFYDSTIRPNRFRNHHVAIK